MPIELAGYFVHTSFMTRRTPTKKLITQQNRRVFGVGMDPAFRGLRRIRRTLPQRKRDLSFAAGQCGIGISTFSELRNGARFK
jgi:hypothetical protein